MVGGFYLGVCEAFRWPSRIEPSRRFLIWFLHRPPVVTDSPLPVTTDAEDFPWLRGSDGVFPARTEMQEPALADRQIMEVNQQS